MILLAMDQWTGDPFQEHEKRQIVSEALRTSTVPIEKLLNFLQQEGELDMPRWEHMILPRGRNLHECRVAFDSLRNAPVNALPPFQAPTHSFQNVNKRKSDSSLLEQPYSVPPAKRRQPGEMVAGARNINIQPKPPNGGSPILMGTTTLAPAPKRRGRPPKAEVDRRTRDAMQRGELFPAQLSALSPDDYLPSPYTPIAPTPPAMGLGSQPIQGSHEQMTPERQPDDMLGKKKRPKAAAKILKPSPPKQPGESSFSVNPQVPVVRDPAIRTQSSTSTVAISELLQAPAASASTPVASVKAGDNGPPNASIPATVTTTSTESQLPAQAVS